MRSGKKYFLYKMVLLTIHIREKHEGAICEQVLDGEPCMEPVDQDQRVTLIREFINVYYESGNHSDWV